MSHLDSKIVSQSSEKSGQQELFRACYNGDLVQVRTVLHVSTVDMNTEYKRLTHGQFDQHKWPDGLTCLMFAAIGGHCEILKFLLQTGKVHVDHQSKANSGATALHYAAQRGHVSVIYVLCRLGRASVDIRTFGNDETPLMWACYEANSPAVEALLKLGANPSAKDSMGRRAEDFVAANESSSDHHKKRSLAKLKKFPGRY